MEQERDTNLQVDPLTVIMIVESCIQAAAWAYKHRKEIEQMVKSGWRDVKAIINHLKKKYGH
jgi:hypothetical protein